jgi:hypothetical protein
MDSNTKSVKTQKKPVRMYLKPERVQIMLLLQALPGWQVLPNGRVIDRVRQFPSTELAMAYATFSDRLARGMRLPISIHVADQAVLLTLRSPIRHGRLQPLTERVLDLARQLG